MMILNFPFCDWLVQPRVYLKVHFNQTACTAHGLTKLLHSTWKVYMVLVMF